MISLIISSLTYCLLRSMLLNFHIFVNFPKFLLLMSNFTPLWSENILSLTSIFLKCIETYLRPNIWSILESVPHAFKKNVYSAFVKCNVPQMSVNSSQFIVFFKFFYFHGFFFFCFCFPYFLKLKYLLFPCLSSIIGNGVLKSLVIIIESSISLILSVFASCIWGSWVQFCIFGSMKAKVGTMKSMQPCHSLQFQG